MLSKYSGDESAKTDRDMGMRRRGKERGRERERRREKERGKEREATTTLFCLCFSATTSQG